jgi:Phage integrase family
MVGHDALLRGGELMSEIKAQQITWWPRDRGFTLHLFRTKTVRHGEGVLIQVPDHAANPMSGVKLLKRWWQFSRLQSHPDAYVFPAVRYGQIDASRPASTAHLRKLVKAAVTSIGLNPADFSAHSLRAGGATDLFAAHVPYHIIKKMGRWVSDAAMLYYRSEEDAWAAVGAAFSALAAEHCRAL